MRMNIVRIDPTKKQKRVVSNARKRSKKRQ